MTVYAHSTPDPDGLGWESLTDHLTAVDERASEFASVFGWGAVAGLSGRLHDIGKCSAAFQAYIRKERSSGGDHSGAGAREALAAVPAPLGQALAAIIAGHHAGLADGVTLDERLNGPLPLYPHWQAHSGPLPAPAALVPTLPFPLSPEPGFSGAFLTRMLFSCLVDADSLETERFYAGAEVDRGPFRELATLRDRLDIHMAKVTGAWIETIFQGTIASRSRSRSLHGGMDRNVSVPALSVQASGRSLHGGVDRNSTPVAPTEIRPCRSLHGGVDQNH